MTELREKHIEDAEGEVELICKAMAQQVNTNSGKAFLSERLVAPVQECERWRVTSTE